MGPIILACIGLYLMSTCEGLTLTLLRNSDGESPCALLTCTESIGASTNAEISRFVVTQESPGPWKPKVSYQISVLTPQMPRDTQYLHGPKVDGWLKRQKGSVQIELFKDYDCNANYLCEAKGVDKHGSKFEHSSRLIQHQVQKENRVEEPNSTLAKPPQRENQTREPNSTPAKPPQKENQCKESNLAPAQSLQLFATIQQLVFQSVGGLQDKIEALSRDNTNGQTKLENTLLKLSKDLEEKSDSFQRRIEDRLFRFENRVEDKIDNDNILNKLIALDPKLPIAKAQIQSELTNKLNEWQREVIASISKKFEKPLNDTFDQLSPVTERNQCTSLAIRNETNEIRELLASGESLSQKILSHVAKLDSSFKNYTATAESELCNVLSNSVVKDSLDLRTVMIDILTPKVCRKGMAYALSHSTSRYITINPNQTSDADISFPHLCDVATDGGGWVVIQRRAKGDVIFNRNWTDYKQGFGSFNQDFWLGNDNIHAITRTAIFELQVDLTHGDKHAYAHYSSFHVGSESEKYKLKIGTYDGTAGDSLTYHNGRPFSTVDRDNDAWDKNCAAVHGGGWWFGACDHSDLNGNWGGTSDSGVEWEKLAGSKSVSFAQMKIRRI